MRLAAAAVATGERLLEPGWLEVDGTLITAVGEGDPPRGTEDLGDVLLAPGFVDLQLNGTGRVDFARATPDELAAALITVARTGCTTCLPTIVTAARDAYGPALDAIATARTRDAALRSRIGGVHLEGPYLGGAPGAHPAELVRPVDLDELDALCDRHDRLVRVVTLAPEADPGFAATRRLAGRGIAVAIGHTGAGFDDVEAMIDAGATLVTHVYNGMAAFHHRDPGPVGAALTDERVAVSVIADLVHVHPAAIRLAAAAQKNLFLVTDAVAAEAGAVGDVRFTSPGAGPARLADGTLTGSTLTMAEALRNAVALGIPVARAVAMAATIPAAAAGLHDRGRLAAGMLADLVCLDRAGLRELETWIGGRRIE
jgi:N-acetylglucosamine-6-phosphate deacetylase